MPDTGIFESEQAATKKALAQAGEKAGPPPRESFTLAEQNLAAIPDIPDARFFGDSEPDFMRALPATRALAGMSSGGADGAFGAA